VLFFLHADTIPPLSFLNDIASAYLRGYAAGCYRLSFNYDHWFLRLNCWFTKFNFTPFRFGDQGLFVYKEVFEKIGGFDSKLILLEDQEIIWRIKAVTKFRVFNKPVITCARKYLVNGIFRLQFVFILLYCLYHTGLSQEKLVRLYKWLIHDEKIDRELTNFSGVENWLQLQDR
jgi:hypothetical protein